MDALSRALHLRRHATFDCTITLNELVNVPLVSGRFKVKWKFSHAAVGAVHYAHTLEEKGIEKVGEMLAHAGIGPHHAGGTKDGDDDDSPSTTEAETEREGDSMSAKSSPIARFRTSSSRSGGELSSNLGSSQLNQSSSRSPLRGDDPHTTPRPSADTHGSRETTPLAQLSGSENAGSRSRSGSANRAPRTSGAGSGPRTSDTADTYRSFGVAMSGKRQSIPHNLSNGSNETGAGGTRMSSDDASRNWGNTSHYASQSLHLAHQQPQQQQPQQQQQQQQHSSGQHQRHPSHEGPIEVPTSAQASGSTPYTDLSHHTVSFRRAFRCAVSIPVGKDGTLASAVLKLTIKEEGVDEDGKRRAAKHGEVDLDLAGLAPTLPTLNRKSSQGSKLSSNNGHGNGANGSANGNAQARKPSSKTVSAAQKTRQEKQKLLLANCKTNASLKLEVKMEFVSGEMVYKTRAPPTNANSESLAQMIASHNRQNDDARSTSSGARRSSGSSHSLHSMARSSSSHKLKNRKSDQTLSSSHRNSSSYRSLEKASHGSESPTQSRRKHHRAPNHHHHHHHRHSRAIDHGGGRDPSAPTGSGDGAYAQAVAADLMDTLFSPHYINHGPVAGRIASTRYVRDKDKKVDGGAEGGKRSRKSSAKGAKAPMKGEQEKVEGKNQDGKESEVDAEEEKRGRQSATKATGSLNFRAVRTTENGECVPIYDDDEVQGNKSNKATPRSRSRSSSRGRSEQSASPTSVDEPRSKVSSNASKDAKRQAQGALGVRASGTSG